jgi:hypothetical protein
VKQSENEKQPESEKQSEQHRQEKESSTPVQEKSTGIVQPMIDELRYPKDAPEAPKTPPRGPVHPPEPQPAELDQDAGGGYNPNHTFPQP